MESVALKVRAAGLLFRTVFVTHARHTPTLAFRAYKVAWAIDTGLARIRLAETFIGAGFEERQALAALTTATIRTAFPVVARRPTFHGLGGNILATRLIRHFGQFHCWRLLRTAKRAARHKQQRQSLKRLSQERQSVIIHASSSVYSQGQNSDFTIVHLF